MFACKSVTDLRHGIITLLDATDIIRTSGEENELDKAEKNAGSTVYLWEK